MGYKNNRKVNLRDFYRGYGSITKFVFAKNNRHLGQLVGLSVEHHPFFFKQFKEREFRNIYNQYTTTRSQIKEARPGKRAGYFTGRWSSWTETLIEYISQTVAVANYKELEWVPEGEEDSPEPFAPELYSHGLITPELYGSNSDYDYDLSTHIRAPQVHLVTDSGRKLRYNRIKRHDKYPYSV